MKLRDGTPFHLGMTVVLFSGREIKTSPEEHEVRSVQLERRAAHCLHLKGGSCGYDLALMYPSQEARIKHQVGVLEIVKVSVEEEIKYLQEGGNPDECHFLHQG